MMRWPFRRAAPEPQESLWAMRQIMSAAQAEIARGDGELKPARRLVFERNWWTRYLSQRKHA